MAKRCCLIFKVVFSVHKSFNILITNMKNQAWFENESDWVLKRSIIFNKDLVKLTFVEVGRLIKLIGVQPKGLKVLDLCCGIGRHSLEMARCGLQVTGVDITRPYLDIAQQNSSRQGLDIEFIHSDMKEFRRPEYFDLIVNLCTSFGYFDRIEDDIQVLVNMHDSLKPHGKFVMEILGKEVIAASFREQEVLEADGYHVVAKSRIMDNWTRLECIRTITKERESKEITAYHRLYSATELKGHLLSVGFKDIQVFGDFSGAPYDNKAKSMVLIAGK
jgi:2-polyprenyl-3-methyl-5-hydroxy-6-metoxy-1,4-benzoquinol methylase